MWNEVTQQVGTLARKRPKIAVAAVVAPFVVAVLVGMQFLSADESNDLTAEQGSVAKIESGSSAAKEISDKPLRKPAQASGSSERAVSTSKPSRPSVAVTSKPPRAPTRSKRTNVSALKAAPRKAPPIASIKSPHLLVQETRDQLESDIDAFIQSLGKELSAEEIGPVKVLRRVFGTGAFLREFELLINDRPTPTSLKLTDQQLVRLNRLKRQWRELERLIITLANAKETSQ